jgi:hypothetical protein
MHVSVLAPAFSLFMRLLAKRAKLFWGILNVSRFG